MRAVRKYTSFGPRLGPFFFNHPNIENVELPGSVHPYLPMFMYPFFLAEKHKMTPMMQWKLHENSKKTR